MTTTTKLNLPLIAPAQAQKHVPVNESLRKLDTIVQLSVKDRDLTAPPGTPSEGDVYLPASGATGAWAGWDHNIALYTDGAWVKLVPRRGWLCWVEDEGVLLTFGTSWDSGLAKRESGNFTPTGNFTTPGNFVPTYTAQVGRYVLIGGVCHYWLYVGFNSNAYTTAAGQFYIGGLPFPVVNDADLGFDPGSSPFLSMVTLNALDRWAVAFARANTNQIWFYSVRSAASVVAMGIANILPSTNAIGIRVAGSYRIA
ncbi:DUF2793 domain-containing protein [Mesorhizobium sp. DCY119]|uniref:DUF2793 domain-containing protein n=1 Tax=Mesorhizobium sp. DCY119 TaxID=2108445 RepID=UPI0018D529DB|nr:DUF2793 domain-containing protein [Mesorhizobium sp. DCY119]